MNYEAFEQADMYIAELKTQLAEAQAKLQEAEQKNKELRKLLREASGNMSYGHWSSDFRNQVERALK